MGAVRARNDESSVLAQEQAKGVGESGVARLTLYEMKRLADSFGGSVSKSVEIHAKRKILSASTSSFSENCRGDSVNRPPEIIKWASQGSPLQMLE